MWHCTDSGFQRTEQGKPIFERVASLSDPLLEVFLEILKQLLYSIVAARHFTHGEIYYLIAAVI